MNKSAEAGVSPQPVQDSASPDMGKVREALEACRDRFAEYVEIHVKKGDAVKADRNRAMLHICLDALASLPAPQRQEPPQLVDAILAAFPAVPAQEPASARQHGCWCGGQCRLDPQCVEGSMT